jgi:hypothetical protein
VVGARGQMPRPASARIAHQPQARQQGSKAAIQQAHQPQARQQVINHEEASNKVSKSATTWAS